jgi:hypothetical protein
MRSDVERALRLKSEGGHEIAQRRAHRQRHPAAGRRAGPGDFAELDRHAPGFHARRKRDGRQLACCEPFDKVILWAGVTASGITAMSYLFESGLILPVFVSHLVYQQCANIPELPRAGTVPLAEEQWAPAILRRGPFPDLTAEEERRSTETLLAATLAARGAARIH